MSNRWWILLAMSAAISMIFIDVTVLPVALPTIHRELNLSDVGAQWVINAYTLLLTILLLGGGRLADLLGARRIFCLGIILFAGASACCGIGSQEWMLIAGRALQGVGGAMMLPASQTILANSFPSHQRGKAMGIYVSIGSIFLAMGPLIGGAITQYWSWRGVFWINIPIALVGLLLTMLIVPRSVQTKARFDVSGLLALAIGISSIIVALMQAQVWGWGDPLTVTLVCFGFLLIFLLFQIDREVPFPIVDLSIITHRSFFTGASCIFFSQLSMVATVFWAIYFQDVLHFPPSYAGLLTFIANAPVLLSAPFAGHLVDQLGPRKPVTFGYALILFSLIWFISFPTPSSIYFLLPSLIPFGIGVPMILTPSYVSLINDVPAEKRGIAAGLNMTQRQFAATLGLALMGTLFYPGRNDPLSNATEGTLSAFRNVNLLAAGSCALGLLIALFFLSNSPHASKK